MRSWTFFLLAAALAAQTQTGEVTTRDETPTFQSSVNLVRIPVVIRDKQGHTIGTFHKEDFQLPTTARRSTFRSSPSRAALSPNLPFSRPPKRRSPANQPPPAPSW